MLDNYPPGAANDPCAPYNEPNPSELTYSFEISIAGKAYIHYYNREDLDNKEDQLSKDLSWLKDKLCDDLDQRAYDIKVDINVENSGYDFW